MTSQHIYSSYSNMNHYGLSYGANPVTSTDSMYPSYTPNVKLEYPNMCMQSNYGLSSSIPASTNGIYPSSVASTMHSSVSTSSASKQVCICIYTIQHCLGGYRNEGLVPGFWKALKILIWLYYTQLLCF